VAAARDRSDGSSESRRTFLYLIGRLNDGVTLDAAKAELDTLLAGWPSSIALPANATGVHTPDTKNHRLRSGPLRRKSSAARRPLCSSCRAPCVRAADRVRESREPAARARRVAPQGVARRSALGAGRARLLRQFMVEGCLLSFAGAALRSRTSRSSASGAHRRVPDRPPEIGRITLDPGPRFTPLGRTRTGAIFGLAPAACLGADATSLALKEGGQRTTAGAGRNRVRRALVARVALAVALVIGAGLLLRTVLNCRTSTPGSIADVS